VTCWRNAQRLMPLCVESLDSRWMLGRKPSSYLPQSCATNYHWSSTCACSAWMKMQQLQQKWNFLSAAVQGGFCVYWIIRARCRMCVTFHIYFQCKQGLRDKFIDHILIVNKLEMKWQSAGWQSPIMEEADTVQSELSESDILHSWQTCAWTAHAALYHHSGQYYVTLFCDKAQPTCCQKEPLPLPSWCAGLLLEGAGTHSSFPDLVSIWLFLIYSGEGATLGMLIWICRFLQQDCHCIITSRSANYIAAVDYLSHWWESVLTILLTAFCRRQLQMYCAIVCTASLFQSHTGYFWNDPISITFFLQKAHMNAFHKIL
jgi:hypothetical protein